MTKMFDSAIGLAGLCLFVGCYTTNNIKNGGLLCGPNDACPDGFRCLQDAPAGKHCWRNGTGPDAAGGTGGSSDTVGGKQDGAVIKSDAANPSVCPAPFGPFPGCQAGAAIGVSTCDPVCQSGCACDRRCVLNTDTYASFFCEATAAAPTTFIAVQGICNGASSANCAPGSVCISDDVCPWTCFDLSQGRRLPDQQPLLGRHFVRQEHAAGAQRLPVHAADRGLQSLRRRQLHHGADRLQLRLSRRPHRRGQHRQHPVRLQDLAHRGGGRVLYHGAGQLPTWRGLRRRNLPPDLRQAGLRIGLPERRRVQHPVRFDELRLLPVASRL